MQTNCDNDNGEDWSMVYSPNSIGYEKLFSLHGNHPNVKDVLEVKMGIGQALVDKTGMFKDDGLVWMHPHSSAYDILIGMKMLYMMIFTCQGCQGG